MICLVGCGLEEKYIKDTADPSDGWTCCSVEELLCLCYCFHWQVIYYDSLDYTVLVYFYCNYLSCITTTTTTILRPFVQDYPGEPVPEETFTHSPVLIII